MIMPTISQIVPETCVKQFQHNTGAPLLRLPGELRNEIYKHVFDTVLRSDDLCMLKVCRQVHHEAHRIARNARPEDVWCEPMGQIEKDDETLSRLKEEIDHISPRRAINLHISNNKYLYTTGLFTFIHKLADTRLPEIITLWNVQDNDLHTRKSWENAYKALKMLAEGIIELGLYDDTPVILRVPIVLIDDTELDNWRGKLRKAIREDVANVGHWTQVYVVAADKEEPSEFEIVRLRKTGRDWIRDGFKISVCLIGREQCAEDD